MKNRWGLCCGWLAVTACLLSACAAGGKAVSNESTTTKTTSEPSVVSCEDSDQVSEYSETVSEATTTAKPTTVTTTAKATTRVTAAKKTTEKPTKATAADSQTTTANGFSLTVKDGATYVDGVLIANKTYSLPASYNPGSLTDTCYEAFLKMQRAAAGEGLNLYISSGFRSYDTQEVIYNRYVANDGKANADRYSARPGYSEHQTGLAIDLNTISDSFANTAEGKWVAAHGHEYGFILRYPKGKEAQTGYMYEPWHIRYVGVKAATAIYESGLSLEEYYGITSAYTP